EDQPTGPAGRVAQGTQPLPGTETETLEPECARPDRPKPPGAGPRARSFVLRPTDRQAGSPGLITPARNHLGPKDHHVPPAPRAAGPGGGGRARGPRGGLRGGRGVVLGGPPPLRPAQSPGGRDGPPWRARAGRDPEAPSAGHTTAEELSCKATGLPQIVGVK